ncbi:MAG: cyclic pyranopterin monophosphate synthase MoaC [Nanoarchaeota archaeon]
MGTVDISGKPVVRRMAVASGRIVLRKETVEKVKRKETRKGDVLTIAEVACLTAVKQTALLIPHCHQVPIDSIQVRFMVGNADIKMSCEVVAFAKTGVEMEALLGVSVGLNTLWDAVKYLEKDDDGQYPVTRITDIVVEKKEKGE